jgi:hypothetical protein
VFNRQIVNFREACFFLFGYRVDMASKATATAGAGTPAATFVLTPQVLPSLSTVMQTASAEPYILHAGNLEHEPLALDAV